MNTTTIEDMGEWLIDQGRERGLAHLAALVLRRARADAAALLSRAIAGLAGSSRLSIEADRISAILAAATPPADLAAAPVAPARGPMRMIDNVTRLPGGQRRRDGRYGRMLDQLSVMNRQAWVLHEGRGGEAEGFRAPFDPGQIGMALRYQALIERHAAAGVKCASAEVRAVARSGGGGDFMEAYLSEGRELVMIINRIGPGIALEVQRGRAGRRDITTRALVDAVCLQGADLTTVLKAHGWSKKTDSLDTLRRALAAALDRMQGYREKPS